MNIRELLWAYWDLLQHLFFDGFQLTWGIWKISRLDSPLVSIFGSSKLPGSSPYSKFARELAARIVDADISVITGGGPGIMEAANCGAKKEAKGRVRSMGIGVRGLEGGKLNPCVEDYIIMHYYYPRKWLLTKYSLAYVIFPGGVGTLEELTELMTLIQTKKRKPAPIILVGTDYWLYIMKWLKETALAHHLIFASDLEHLTMTDDIEVAYKIIVDHCRQCKKN